MYTRNRNKVLSLAGTLLATGLFAQAAVANHDAGFVYFPGERGVDYQTTHTGVNGTPVADASKTITGEASGFRYVGAERGWAYLPTHEGPAGAQVGADLVADGEAFGFQYVGGELGTVNTPINPAFEARIQQYQDARTLARE